MGIKTFLGNRNWHFRFSVLFVPSCLLIYSLNLFYGRSLLHAGANQSGDGLLQHFNALAYYGERMRTILRNIVVAHRIEIPMWDSNIGLGGDVITTLGYYALGDSLALLPLFIPKEYTEYLYNSLVIVGLYLSRLAFCAFCKYYAYKESDNFPGCRTVCSLSIRL